MSIFDEGRDIAEKAERLAKEHPQQTDEAIERGEALVDERTGHRYDKQVEEAGQRAEEFLTGKDSKDAPREGERPPTP